MSCNCSAGTSPIRFTGFPLPQKSNRIQYRCRGFPECREYPPDFPRFPASGSPTSRPSKAEYLHHRLSLFEGKWRIRFPSRGEYRHQFKWINRAFAIPVPAIPRGDPCSLRSIQIGDDPAKRLLLAVGMPECRLPRRPAREGLMKEDCDSKLAASSNSFERYGERRLGTSSG
jgi:hypothetical protein